MITIIEQIENLQELYEKDYLLWLEKTIKSLSDRHFNQIDFEHLIEELTQLGNEQKRAVESLLEQIIRHLLLYQYWQSEYDRNAHHWSAEIISFRNQLKRRLTTNLRNHLTNNLDSIYADALDYVRSKTNLNIFPNNLPYTLEQLLDKTYL